MDRCDFCKETDNFISIVVNDWCYVDARFDAENNEIDVHYYEEEEYVDGGSFKINFCPMCGLKLAQD